MPTKLATHRHLRKKPFVGLSEAVKLMTEYGQYWHIQGPFKYCPICNCVPTSSTGQHIEEVV
jgi:hypothetical protein